MKRIFLVFCLLLLISCNFPFSPGGQGAANIVLDGSLSATYTSYHSPQFEGYVKNTGNRTGYNCKVAITCYSDAAQTTIIDTANGFPANLGDIQAGERAYFNAVCFDLDSHSQIQGTRVNITWLNR